MNLNDLDDGSIEFRESDDPTTITPEDFRFLMLSLKDGDSANAEIFRTRFLEKFSYLNGNINLKLLHEEIESNIFKFINDPDHIYAIEKYLREVGIGQYLNQFSKPLGIFKPVIRSSTSFRNEIVRDIAILLKDTIFDISLNFHIKDRNYISKIVQHASNSGYNIIGDAVSKVLKQKIQELEENENSIVASRLKSAPRFTPKEQSLSFEKLELESLQELERYKHFVESIILFFKVIPDGAPKNFT